MSTCIRALIQAVFKVTGERQRPWGERGDGANGPSQESLTSNLGTLPEVRGLPAVGRQGGEMPGNIEALQGILQLHPSRYRSFL